MKTPQDLDVIRYLRSPEAIRERCGLFLSLACDDRLTHFRCDLDRLDTTAGYVIEVMQASYPGGQVPFHSRWRHFTTGGIDRLSALQQQMQAYDAVEQARIQFDLVIPSVLLDAGAGAAWQYQEPETGKTFARSEGLAVASFHLFCSGAFSADVGLPLRSDAEGLRSLTESQLAAGFQVGSSNPLVGLEGRLALMHQLGEVIAQQPQRFGAPGRLGNLVDFLLTEASNGELSAVTVFNAVLAGFSEIWAGRETIAGVNLGDVWPHSALPNTGLGSNLVPFHKLSQWLTYSLLEPLQALGLTITDLDRLTGLAEYRNGGLCLDLGLLQSKSANILTDRYLPSSEVIVEWRALTVVLLDAIADTMRQKLGMSAQELPLVKVLEGGTWAAGRKIAAHLRDGTPPIAVDSDGTVF